MNLIMLIYFFIIKILIRGLFDVFFNKFENNIYYCLYSNHIIEVINNEIFIVWIPDIYFFFTEVKFTAKYSKSIGDSC